MGTTIGFLDNAGKHTRFYEIADIAREGAPNVVEQSKVVSKLFENDLTLISNSRENDVIFFSEEDTTTLYGYRYFDNIRERKLAAWFKWTLTGNIKYHCMQDDSLYVVVNNNSKDQLLKYTIKADTNTVTLAEDRIHLDHIMLTSGWTYNPTTDKSTRNTHTGLESDNQLAAYDTDDPGVTPPETIGNYGKITVDKTTPPHTLSIDGDWSGQSFYIGYLYEMSVTVPTIYFSRKEGETWTSDTRSNTILHRVKIGFGPVGVYETTLQRKGRKDYTEIFEVTPANHYLANSSGILNDEILRTVPIYDRNINSLLTIKSTHPSPATLHNLTWEGVYNNKFYERV